MARPKGGTTAKQWEKIRREKMEKLARMGDPLAELSLMDPADPDRVRHLGRKFPSLQAGWDGWTAQVTSLKDKGTDPTAVPMNLKAKWAK